MARDDQETYGYDEPPPRPSVVPWIVAGLAVIAGGVGAVMLWTRLQSADADAARTRAALDLVTAEKAQLAQRVEKVEAERADLLTVKNELSTRVAAKDEELQKLQGTYRELESKMKEEIAKGDVRLSQSGGRIKVDLVDKILFDVGEATVTERGAGVLSRVGAVLVNVEDKKIQVSGHTDDQPISDRLKDRFPTNWELAAARANNVVRYLEEKANVPGRRLVAAAYGPWEPISSNRSPKGRARNRRIEIVLTPQLAPAPIDGAVAKVAKAEPAKPAAAPAKAAAAKGKATKKKPAAH
ncbi:MAG TPA: flagellar motor protein MotB [Anaeromyxobacter sp.]